MIRPRIFFSVTYILILSLVSSILCFSVSAKETDQVLQALVSTLDNIQTFQARYLQETHEPSLNTQDKILIQRGKLTFKKPGAFRLELEAPDNQLLVSEGKWLWHYDIDLEQVTKHQLDEIQEEVFLLFLTEGSARLISEYNLQNHFKKNQQVIFELKAKKTDNFLQMISFMFNSDRLTSIQVMDRTARELMISFKDIKQNTDLSNSLFHFTPPEGVDVL